VYSSSSISGNDNGGKSDRGGRVGGGNCYSESADSVLNLLLDLYSELMFSFIGTGSTCCSNHSPE